MKKDIQEYLEGREFYELMQSYRTAPTKDQSLVIRAFEEVKIYIIKIFMDLK